MIMKKILSVFMWVLMLNGCTKDSPNVIINSDNCLVNKIPRLSPNDCNSINGNSHCEYNYIGSKRLSEKSKSFFTDYCKGLNSIITFKNQNGNELLCTVDEHRFVTSRAAISTNYTSNDCKTYCLNTVEATWGITSERFALEINLLLNINYDINAQYLDDKINNSFIIWAKERITQQSIFIMPIEDAKGNEIIPDTTFIRLHKTIMLNGETYTNVYSNENLKANGLIRKEIVNFNKSLGLIAVRDSLGTLWRKN